MLIHSHGLTLTPFWWIWLAGVIVLVTAWLLNWHRAVLWTGALLTLLQVLFSMVASIVVFIAIAANYYDTGVEFSFVFFSIDWFWAGVIFTFIIGLSMGRMLDKQLERIT